MRSRPWLRKPGRTSGARDLEGPLDDLSAVALEWRLRTRSRGRQDVYDIRVEPAHGSSGSLGPRWPASLYDNDGRRHLLWHVDDWQLDDPHAEVSELRGPRWEPRPAVEELILRGWARRRAGPRAMYGALGVLVVMFFANFGRVVEGRPAHSFPLLVCVPVVCSGVLGAVLRRSWTSPPSAHVWRAPPLPPEDHRLVRRRRHVRQRVRQGTASRAQVLPWARAEGSPPLRPVPTTFPPRPLPSYA